MPDGVRPAQSTPRAGGGLVVAAAIVGAGFLGSRLLGVLRTVVIAQAYGSGGDLDAYWVAFRIPDLIFQVLAGATLGSAFIPVFARLYRREGEDRAWEFASTILTLVAIATFILCTIAFVFAPQIVPLLAPDLGQNIGRHDELTGRAVELTRLMLISPFLFAISGMVTGILNARQQFSLSALAPMAYNLAIIAGAVLLSRPFGVTGLAIGVVVGAGLHLAVQIPGLVREGMFFRANLAIDAAVREVGKLMGPRVIGLAAAQLNFVVTTYFASKIGDAAISNLTYAWLLAQLPLAMFGMALSTAVFPQMANHAADNDMEGLLRTVSRVLRIIMFLTIPAALGLVMLRVPATAVLLQHGEFGRGDALITAHAMAFYCLGIVPQAGIEIHSRGFYALGDTRTPVMLAVAAVLINFALSAGTWGIWGVNGLACSISISAWLEWIGLYYFFHWTTRTSVRDDLIRIGQFVQCGAAMAIVLAIGFGTFSTHGFVPNAVTALFGTVAGGLVYAGMANWLGIEELREAISRFGGRIPLLGRLALSVADDGDERPTVGQRH